MNLPVQLDQIAGSDLAAGIFIAVIGAATFVRRMFARRSFQMDDITFLLFGLGMHQNERQLSYQITNKQTDKRINTTINLQHCV